MNIQTISEAYNSYFRFNNQRTLSTAAPSELKISELDALTTYSDPTRRYDNQVVLHTDAAAQQLMHVIETYPAQCSPMICVEPNIDLEPIATQLEPHGYSFTYEHAFLQMKATEYQPTNTDDSRIKVERWGAKQADQFLDLLKTSGVQCSDEIWAQKRKYYCTEQFRCFVAYVDSVPCAWATSYIDGETAILANAYTQEAFRNQGCQSALLHARIADGVEFGASLLLTDVLPNTPSSRNCEKAGFTTRAIKQVWSKK